MLGPVGAYQDSLALVRGFQETGQPELLNALFDRYYDRVRRIARIRMGARLRLYTESDDLVQETFAVAFGKMADLHLGDHSSVIQYLSRVLENQIRGAVDYYEAQRRSPTSGAVLSTASDSVAGSPLLVSPGPSPGDEVQTRELAQIYDECVQSLDPVHREVVILREYSEASWESIRVALERPTEHAARLLYSRAQIKLATALRLRLGDREAP